MTTLRHSHRAPGCNDETGSQSESHMRSSSRNVDPVEMEICFLRLENFNPCRIELIGRYETRLWRQLAQTILILDTMRRKAPRKTSRYQPALTKQPSVWYWKSLTCVHGKTRVFH
jgi:hypothetical protein